MAFYVLRRANFTVSELFRRGDRELPKFTRIRSWDFRLGRPYRPGWPIMGELIVRSCPRDRVRCELFLIGALRLGLFGVSARLSALSKQVAAYTMSP